MVKQISVFVENKKGRLARITDVLGKGGIDLIALSIADTTNFGIMRCIVNDPEKTLKLLKENDITASTTEVIAEAVDSLAGFPCAGRTKRISAWNTCTCADAQ